MITQFIPRAVLCLCFLLALACTQPPANPNTPEEVARKWQEYMDENQFEEARTLSTEGAKEIVDMIEMIFTDEGNSDDWISETVFVEMKCREQQDTAICTCLIKEEDELIQDSFLLVKVAGQWLVDIAEEDLEEGPGIERMIEELEQIMGDSLGEDSLIIQ